MTEAGSAEQTDKKSGASCPTANALSVDTGPGKLQEVTLRLEALPIQIYEMGLSLLLMWAIQHKTLLILNMHRSEGLARSTDSRALLFSPR